MNELISAIATGITAFTATNIDDIVILTLFFSQVDATFRPQHVVIGQYFGVGALIVASLVGFFGGLIVPKSWIGLLGLLPILIGIHQLRNSDEDEGQVQAVSGKSNYVGTKSPVVLALSSLFSPQTYHVAAVSFANGGDNIGIYVPLFASSNPADLGVILVVFFLLIGVWCYVTYRLAHHPTVAHVLVNRAEKIVPFVLIGLGVFILIECGTFQLLPTFRSSLA